MELTSSDYELLRHDGGAFLLNDYKVVEFSGSEWREWLQGQITNDVRNLTPEHSISFCLCKPTGQILAPGDLHEVDGKGWMVVPASTVPAILHRVGQMVILEDCTAQVLDAPIHHVLFAEEGLPAHRTLWPGRDVVGDYTGPTMKRYVLNLASMESAIPIWGVDMDESNFPAEMGERFKSQTMSYTKGCYTGQEVNHRIHSRGHTNKTWGVYLSDDEPKAGDDMLDADGQKIGTITRVEFHPDLGWMLGAFVKNGTNPVLTEFQP